MKQTNVGIYIFNDVEVLDFAGPFEVFSRTRLVPGVDSRRSTESAPFNVFTVAQSAGPITATGGLPVIPNFTWRTAPPIEILVVPGGFGTRPLLADTVALDWIRTAAGQARLATSVCSGALLMAKAGLLNRCRATTHFGAYDLLATLDPTIAVERGVRVVHDRVVTSAGVSAGIDMAFDIVARECGRDVALETAHYIEYHWTEGVAVGA